MTALETMMPISWNTSVIHFFTFHTLEIILKAGPFPACNILDIERFHTMFKSLARGTQVMPSIKNHYLLLEVALNARLTADMEWTRLATRSTAAGLAGRLDSSDKTERMWHPKGKARKYTFPEAGNDRVQLRTLWADEYDEYKSLHKKFKEWKRLRMQSKTARDARRKVKFIEEWDPPPAYKAPFVTVGERRWLQMSFTAEVDQTHTLSRAFMQRIHSVVHSYAHTHALMCTWFLGV
jgi:cell division protein FtsL